MGEVDEDLWKEGRSHLGELYYYFIKKDDVQSGDIWDVNYFWDNRI